MKLHSAIFYTSDISIVRNFYLDLLGFDLDYESEGKFISINIGKEGKLGIKKQVEERELPGYQTIFIEIDHIDELYFKLKNSDVTILKELTEEKWAKEFSILDPDGNKIVFRGN